MSGMRLLRIEHHLDFIRKEVEALKQEDDGLPSEEQLVPLVDLCFKYNIPDARARHWARTGLCRKVGRDWFTTETAFLERMARD